jgi:hypothetical protein
MKNFTRPKNEKLYYYSSSVEAGKVIKHDGDPKHAVYLTEIEELRRRSNLWHRWLDKNVVDPYDSLGAVKDRVYFAYSAVREQFMNGERDE